MLEHQLHNLLYRWKQAFGRYQQYKNEAEKAVVRWEWTTGARYSSLPHHFLRHPGRGRILNNEPTDTGNYFQYGFDETGKVRLHKAIVIRNFKAANLFQRLTSPLKASNQVFSETFYLYTDNKIEIIEYSCPPLTPIPLSIQLVVSENGRIQSFSHLKLNGYTPLYSQKGKNPEELYEWLGDRGHFITIEDYHHKEDQLVSISGYYEFPGIPPHLAHEDFTYDETGFLQRIDRYFEDGQKQAIYRKRQKGQTFLTIRKEATKKLVGAIIQRIQAENIQERLYCIELSYRRGGESFPPCIIAIPEKYRLKIIQSRDPDARFTIFSPIIEKAWFLTINDPDTLEICQILEQEVLAGELWDAATSILRDVARILTQQDWTQILKVTPDFVVFALDPEIEGDHLAEILRNSVSEMQVQEWKAKGWLD